MPKLTFSNSYRNARTRKCIVRTRKGQSKVGESTLLDFEAYRVRIIVLI